MSSQTTRERVRFHLSRIYSDLGQEGLSALADRVLAAAHVEGPGWPERCHPAGKQRGHTDHVWGYFRG